MTHPKWRIPSGASQVVHPKWCIPSGASQVVRPKWITSPEVVGQISRQQGSQAKYLEDELLDLIILVEQGEAERIT
jgi:hypothetical protein